MPMHKTVNPEQWLRRDFISWGLELWERAPRYYIPPFILTKHAHKNIHLPEWAPGSCENWPVQKESAAEVDQQHPNTGADPY